MIFVYGGLFYCRTLYIQECTVTCRAAVRSAIYHCCQIDEWISGYTDNSEIVFLYILSNIFEWHIISHHQTLFHEIGLMKFHLQRLNLKLQNVFRWIHARHS